VVTHSATPCSIGVGKGEVTHLFLSQESDCDGFEFVGPIHADIFGPAIGIRPGDYNDFGRPPVEGLFIEFFSRPNGEYVIAGRRVRGPFLCGEQVAGIILTPVEPAPDSDGLSVKANQVRVDVADGQGVVSA
jgi:hypothetical protein